MGNGRKIMFLKYGSMRKIGILKPLIVLYLDYLLGQPHILKVSGILPDLGFVLGYFNINAFFIKIRAVL